MTVVDGQNEARDPDVLEARVFQLIPQKTLELPLKEFLQPGVAMASTLVADGTYNASAALLAPPGT